MSHSSPSRATLADLLPLIEAQVPAVAKRDDMKSAVRKVAQALGRPLDAIPIDPKTLGIQLKKVSPVNLNITKARWQNIRSLFRQALALATAVLPGKSKAPIAETWLPLFQHTSLKQSDQTRVSRLLRWLSERGIEPETVTEANLAAFRNDLDTALLSNPEATWRDMVLAWNRAIKTVKGWPAIPITLPSRKITWVLPWSAFPASLKQDVDRWLDRLAGRDLSDDGPPRPLRSASLQTREYQLRSFASALVHQGQEAHTLTSLAICLSLENYHKGLSFYRKRYGNQSTTTTAFASMLKSVATYWLKADDTILKAMKGTVARLPRPQKRMSAKNRDRLRHLRDPEKVQTLLSLPETLKSLVERQKVSKPQEAVVAQIAVALEILLMAPIRIQNLATLDLKSNLIPISDSYILFIDGAYVKNGEDLEHQLPVETRRLIDWYVKTYRDAAPDNRALFPGRTEGFKKVGSLRQQIIKTVKNYTGLDIHPHLFRHIAALIYLDAHPGGYEVIRRILGHKSMETTTSFYAGLEGLSASRHFTKMVSNHRTASRTRWAA